MLKSASRRATRIQSPWIHFLLKKRPSSTYIRQNQMKTPASSSQQPNPTANHNDRTTVGFPGPVTQLKAFLTITCAILVTHALYAQSQLTTLDFNGLTAMADIPGSPVPVSARLSDQCLGSDGVLFNSYSGSPYVAVVSFGDGNIGIASVDS